MRRILICLAICAINIGAYAADYVAIAKDGNVYDEANTKYITVNQNNEDVSVIPGMVFNISQHTPGWYKVEYSPGLHAFIPEQIAASSLKPVQPGTYELLNNPGHKITVTENAGTWSAVSDGNSFKGAVAGDIIVFTDNSNNVAFSVVDLGNGPIAVTYDNSVTKFF